MLGHGEFVGNPRLIVGRKAYAWVGGEFRRCKVDDYCKTIGKYVVDFFGQGRAYIPRIYM